MIKLYAIFTLLILMTTIEQVSARPADDRPFWTKDLAAADFVNIQENRLKKAQAALDRMKNNKSLFHKGRTKV